MNHSLIQQSTENSNTASVALFQAVNPHKFSVVSFVRLTFGKGRNADLLHLGFTDWNQFFFSTDICCYLHLLRDVIPLQGTCI